jgi:predicted nuclease of predicted toxin-antitoxin system
VIRCYTDENISRGVINGLRQRGVDVLSVPEAQMMGASDEAHLTFALEHERIIVTHDDGFLRLAASGKTHAGIVYCSQGLSIGEIIRGLMLLYDVLELEDMQNKVEYL